jgi:urease accessory protein
VPYAARPTPAPDGWARAVLVQTIAGPLAGDETVVEVLVGPGAALELVTNAATLAYPSVELSRYELRVRPAEGARFAWRLGALILAAGCNFAARFELELAAGAAAFSRELVVLGRAGERSGIYRSILRCELDGEPLLHESIEIDAAGVAQSSEAVLSGARATASLALLGLRPAGREGHGELDLEGPGRVLRARASSFAELGSRVEGTESAWVAALRQGSS